MLKINDLHASTHDKSILNGFNLEIKPGETHALMGPNGSGKSTLSKVLAGHPGYEVTAGSILWEHNRKQKDLLDMEPEERARNGIFLAYQYPTEVPGLNNLEFLRASYNALCKHHGTEEMDSFDFKDYVTEICEKLHIPRFFLDRNVNEGFSGGEKKRNEILQMAVLKPRLCILDETDSGLDVDALREVAFALNSLKNSQNAYLMITHYPRLLNEVKADFVHVLFRGKIIRSGDAELAHEIEKNGYERILEGAPL